MLCSFWSCKRFVSSAQQTNKEVYDGTIGVFFQQNNSWSRRNEKKGLEGGWKEWCKDTEQVPAHTQNISSLKIIYQVIHPNILPSFHPTVNFVHTLKYFGLDASVYPHIQGRPAKNPTLTGYQCWKLLSGSTSHTLGFILIRQTTDSVTATVVFPTYQQRE